MVDAVASAVEQRSSLNQLYKQSISASNPNKNTVRQYLSWKDEQRRKIDSNMAIPDNSVISSIDDLRERALKYLVQNSGQKSSGSSLLCFPISLSPSFEGPPCPSIKDISTRLGEESLIPLALNYQGYNFTSEFNMVYKGTFSSVTAYDDLLAVVQKSLLSIDPAISSDLSNQYATYILTQIAWDVAALAPMFEKYLTDRFTNTKKITVKSDNVGINTRVFMGKSFAGHIAFTVRCECDAFISDATVKSNEVQETLPLILYHDHNIESVDQIQNLLKRLQYIHGEVDAFRANAAKVKFKDGFNRDNVRLYIKLKIPTATTALGTQPPPDAVMSDDEDDDSVSNHSDAETDLGKYDSLELDARAPTLPTCSASYCAEVYGWGYDSFYSLGMGHIAKEPSAPTLKAGNGKGVETQNSAASLLDEVFEPRPVPISRTIALEQVRSIACSSRHSLLLTHHGCVYSCGDNAEGALGLGDMHPRNVFTLVEWSTTHKIEFVAAGAGVAGAHSMAIDQKGQLYGWGFTKSIGRGTVQPTLAPVHIPIPADGDIPSTDATEINGQSTRLSAEEIERRRTVRSVACGASFTLCLMLSGEVYAFGQWAHGRLGLGPVPQIQVRGRRMRSTTKLARYQVRPTKILGIESAVAVACGDAHSLCLLASGHVLVWGQNSLGQLGIGPMRSGELKDQFSPVLLPPFGSSLKDKRRQQYNRELKRFVLVGAGPRYQHRLRYLQNIPPESTASIGGPRPIKGRNVVCGAYHSVVQDTSGHCWTWGARGSPCLGHADSKVLGDWGTRISAVFSVATNESEVMVPYELLPWCNLWSTPRRVRAFDTYYTQGSSLAQPSSSKSYYHDDYATVDQQYQQAFSSAVDEEGNEDAEGNGSKENADAFLDDDLTIVTSGDDDLASSSSSSRLKIVQVVAGDLHTVFVTNQGRIYLCGSGPAVPPLHVAASDEDEDNDDETVDVASSQQQAIVVNSPRCPSAQWLSPVCMRAVRYVSTGGCRLFAIYDEETVSLNLSSALYDSLRSNHRLGGRGGEGEDSEDDNRSGIHSMLSSLGTSANDFAHVLLQRGRADCMVIASGYTFLCHRALLAKRSPELRDMILMETPQDGDGLVDFPTSPDTLTQILLPELHRDTARVLAYFLYRDTLPRYVLTNRVLLHGLSRCGRMLKIPRLHLLCERFLLLLQQPHALNHHQDTTNSGSDLSQEHDDNATAQSIHQLDELPPATLSRDLGNLLGDPDFADVRFVAEGRTVAAHRFILEARCPYFRSMFQSGFSESVSLASRSHQSKGTNQRTSSSKIVDVVVPDSFVGFLRLLIFLYTDTLPDGGDGALLEDLMAADRYSFSLPPITFFIVAISPCLCSSLSLLIRPHLSRVCVCVLGH